jgi:hypothetical protein
MCELLVPFEQASIRLRSGELDRYRAIAAAPVSDGPIGLTIRDPVSCDVDRSQLGSGVRISSFVELL